MKTEDLKALGIDDEELIKAIFALHGKSVEKLKTSAEDFKSKYDMAMTQLTEATNMVNSFKEQDIEGIKKAAADWQEKYETSTKESAEKLKAIRFNLAIEKGLEKAKVRNVVATKALLDLAKLSVPEDAPEDEIPELVGLSEQLEAIKSKDDYLFEDVDATPRITTKTMGKGSLSDAFTSTARKAAGLED